MGLNMRKDDRLRRLAENIIKNSVELKKGETIYIEAFGESTRDLLDEFIIAATKAGGVPFYMFNDNAFVRDFVKELREARRPFCSAP